MPSPKSAQIKAALKTALLAKGFIKRSYDAQGILVEDPTSLPDAMDKLVEAFSMGDSIWFQQWLATEVVSIPVTSAPGTPSVGILLP